MPKVNNIRVSVSGGKDSTAVALLAADTGADARMVFADTGNEHPITLEYMARLPELVGLPLDTVKADFAADIARKRGYVDTVWRAEGVPDAVCDRAISALVPSGVPFLDLCLWKGRFPSRKAQFCTQELKRRPLDAYLLAAMESGGCVESWRGERRDESARRRDYAEREVVAEGWTVVRPVATWTAQEVVDFVRGRGVALNPLYSQGFRRVGCAPCINSGKDDLLLWASRHPDVIDRIREWEVCVGEASKRQVATFFPPRDRKSRCEMTNEEFGELANIDEQVAWARTSHGGTQYDMERWAAPERGCASAYGLCE